MEKAYHKDIAYFDEGAMADLVLASLKASGEQRDRAAVLSMLRPQLAQARKLFELMSSGGKKCKAWVEVVCDEPEQPGARLLTHHCAHASGEGGGCSGTYWCLKVGNCAFCLRFECEQVLAPT